MLFLEFLVNSMRVMIFLIPPPEVLNSYNLTESCQIYDYPNIVALLHPYYWILYLPYTLVLSIHFCILPIVNLLITVLIKRYLERPYGRRLRNGFLFILCRFFASSCLLSYFRTQVLFSLVYICIFTIDYSMYLYYARVFHQLLCARRNEARIHQREDPQLFRERSHVLSQYRITTLYSVCVVSVYLFIVFMGKMSNFMNIIVKDPCYVNYITGGYIPTIHFGVHVQYLTACVYFVMFCVTGVALYLYELLVFIAYLAVCVSIVVKYISSLRQQKRTQYQVARIVDEYHRGTAAYRD